MFPILFEVRDFRLLSGEFQVMEIAMGVVAALGWLALHLRGKRNWVASALNLVAFLVLLHIGLSFVMDRSITIYSFGVMIILAFFTGAAYMVRQTRPLGLEDKKIFDWAFWMLVVGIVGSRFFYAYINYEQFQEDKLEVFKIWNGGLVWYGGLVPAAIVGIWLLRRYKLPVLHVADIGAAAVILALGIGRWACLTAGDDYGKVTDLWVGIRFYNPDSLVPAPLQGLPLHPTQLYMSVNCLWIFFVVEVIRRKAKYAGHAFAWMLILYALSRSLLIEPLRGDFVERTPRYGQHVATPLVVNKEAGAPAISLPRGATVVGNDGREGDLLSDLDMPVEASRSGVVHAISRERRDPEEVPGLLDAQSRMRRPPAWPIRTIEGLPEGAQVRSEVTIWYGSHLPEPPGYVSTSQWLSVAVVLAGVGLLLLSRQLKVDGYAAAVEKAREDAAAADAT